MSFQNPFAKQNSKQSQIQSNPTPKVDSTRENVKKTLINALEKQKDNTIQNLVKTSEQIAIEIEKEIYEQNDNSSKSKSYRDKIRKLEMRIKGMRNNYIREILKKGILSVHDFCNLDEKSLNDENFFKKFEKNSGIEANQAPEKNFSKIVKPPNMPKNIIPSIRPVIPKPIVSPIKIEKDKNDLNDNEIKKEEKENKIPEKIEEIKEEIKPVINNDNLKDKNLLKNKPPPKKIEEEKNKNDNIVTNISNELNNIKISNVNNETSINTNNDINNNLIEIGGNNLKNEENINIPSDINNNMKNVDFEVAG